MRFIPIFVLLLLFSACNNRATKETKLDTVTATPQMPTQTRQPDTLFTALGTEPFWVLYVIRDKKILFHPADGSDVEVPYMLPVTIDNVTRQYRVAGDSAALELTIIRNKCSDGMSDNSYPTQVTLKLNAVTYKGCGRNDLPQ